VSFVVISMESDLEPHSIVRARLNRLAAEGVLRLEMVDPWLEELGEYRSLEGHLWDARAHARVASELANHIRGRDGREVESPTAP
jgi:hypothetical protein